MKLVKSTMLGLAIVLAFAPLVSVDAGDARRGRDVMIEERGQELAFLLAPIKTKEDLGRYMEALRQNPEALSPLNALTVAARDRFVNSLVFSEQGGIGGYYYADMRSQLTASQTYRLLSLFGAQHTAHLVGARVENRADQLIMENTIAPEQPVDYADMECVRHATCGPKDGYICKSNC